MRRRVRTVMLLGTRYEAYVASQAGLGDGQEPATDLLSTTSKCVHARSTEEAFELLESEAIDLVLCSTNFGDDEPTKVARSLKERDPELPIVLLSSNRSHLGPLCQAPSIEPFDSVFLWRGERDVLLSIVHWVEDRFNAEHDILLGGVQAILLIEDEPSLYSKYLPMLYREIRGRIHELTGERVSQEERRRREQGRTRVILAHSYEEAQRQLARYGVSICGVLSDMQYPMEGTLHDDAGLHLARYVKESMGESIPVVVQSRDSSVEARAHEVGAFFIWKKSDQLLRQLRKVMSDYFGFGEFIFRTPAGREIGRARDLSELAKRLRDIPDVVFRYHIQRDHFSTWLFIHGEFELASRLRQLRKTGELERSRAIGLIERCRR